MFVGIILEVGGFVLGVDVQDLQVIIIIMVMLVVGLLVVLLFGFYVLIKFKLNKEIYEVLMIEIECFKCGQEILLMVEYKVIVEDFLGWFYDQLWGKNLVGC